MFERIATGFQVKKRQSSRLLRLPLLELLDLLDTAYWQMKFANRRLEIANRRANFANRRMENTSYLECASIFSTPGVCTYYCHTYQKMMFSSMHILSARSSNLGSNALVWAEIWPCGRRQYYLHTPVK